MRTTTGFTTDPFYIWPSFVPLLLIFVAFIGGCARSTAGGMKVIRIILLNQPALREAGLHYADLNNTAKIVLRIAMPLGRLEIYTLLVLLLPEIWHA